MGMIVSTFGEGLAGQIDLKNLSTFIENQVAFEAANVKQVYDTFARRFGTQANARTQRFASSTRTFNYFVTGFTYEKELSLYSAQAQSFYEWSAKLDVWIKEIYALQLSLEMMVNEWSIKIASRYSALEALTQTESELKLRIGSLETKLSQMSIAQEEITSKI
jgi:hypothetical protein